MFNFIITAIASLLSVVAFITYILSIYRKETSPHVFSWIIFGTTTVLAFFAQLADGGGLGAWPIGLSGFIALFIAILAFTRRKDILIDKLDWVFFITGLSAIPVWLLTSNPLWASVIVSIVDSCGMASTIRKIYHYPYSENLWLYGLLIVRNGLSMMVLEHYSLTTLLFPVSLTIVLGILIGVSLVRRKIKKRDGYKSFEQASFF